MHQLKPPGFSSVHWNGLKNEAELEWFLHCCFQAELLEFKAKTILLCRLAVTVLHSPNLSLHPDRFIDSFASFRFHFVDCYPLEWLMNQDFTALTKQLKKSVAFQNSQLLKPQHLSFKVEP